MFKITGVAVMLVAILKQGAFGQDSIEKTADELIPSHLLEHVQGGNFEGITAALEASNEDINLQNSNGWSAARFAVSNGDFDMTRFLIEKQIDLNNPDNEGVTPLMVAAAQCDKELVELLLESNASPTMVAKDGTTAHSAAVTSGRKLVALLIAEAAVLHGIESENSTVVLQALDDGAYVNIRNPAGWTPLIYAAAKGELDTVNSIIAHGADANRNENDGWTALHFAAAGGHVDIVQALLKANIDHTLVNAKDQTAYEIAVELGLQEVVDIIPANNNKRNDL